LPTRAGADHPDGGVAAHIAVGRQHVGITLARDNGSGWHAVARGQSAERVNITISRNQKSL
jgi:hypothetical protein